MSREIDLLAESWHVHRIVFDFAGTDFMDSSGTVSYTHLDVYKRQECIPFYHDESGWI